MTTYKTRVGRQCLAKKTPTEKLLKSVQIWLSNSVSRHSLSPHFCRSDSPSTAIRATVLGDPLRQVGIGARHRRTFGGGLRLLHEEPAQAVRDSVACELTDAFIQAKEADEGTSQAVAGE